MESQKTKAESTTKVVDNLVTRVNNIDGTVNDNEHGILHENSQMKEEISRLKKTVRQYEDRFVEMEGEVQVRGKITHFCQAFVCLPGYTFF